MPEGVVGRELVSRFLPQLGLDEDEAWVEIYYNPGVASAPNYPLESAMPNYACSLTVLLQKAKGHELESKNSSKPIASDRLLSKPAMQTGLIKASIERVNALKNE